MAFIFKYLWTNKDVCSELCSKHEGKVLKYHCLDDDTLCCTVCINLKHKSCKEIKFIPDMAKELPKMQNFLAFDACLQKTQKKSNDITNLAEKNTKKLEACSTPVTFKTHHQALTESESKLNEQAVGFKQEQAGKIRKRLEEIKEHQDVLREMTKQVERLRYGNQNCSLYTYMVKKGKCLKPIDDQLSEVHEDLSKTKSVIKFTPNDHILEMLKTVDKLGKVTLEHEHAPENEGK